MLVERVARFLAGEGEETFEDLALAVFADQYERVDAYRRLCRARGVAPGGIGDWRAVPAAPAALLRSPDLAAAASGTSGDLLGAALDASLPAACLSGLERPPVLGLVPPAAAAPGSVVALAAEHVLARWAGPGSESAWGRGGVEVVRARSWLAARQRDGRPALVLAAAAALTRLLDALERQDLRLRLPAASRLLLAPAGPADGRLAARVAERLTLPPSAVVRAYARDELTSLVFSRALAGEDPEPLVPPPWVRARVLDPTTLDEAPPGAAGLLAVFDLANLRSATHVLTDDPARAEGSSFRLTSLEPANAQRSGGGGVPLPPRGWERERGSGG